MATQTGKVQSILNRLKSGGWVEIAPLPHVWRFIKGRYEFRLYWAPVVGYRILKYKR